MRIALCLVVLLCIAFTYPNTVQASVSVSADNAILMEQSTGRVLYEKKANEQKPIASITKVLTAIIAIESGKMDEYVKTSRRAIHTEGSSIYLEQGEKMTLEDLVYGLMLRSGNDSAVAISEHLGGSVEGFVHMMNEKAQWLGMTNTHFTNPHGLHDDNHYSTAYDMALLMKYAMDNEHFREISSTTSYKSQNRSYAWKNKNKLLTNYYDNSTGGKTGFTKKAGRTLITTAEKDNLEMIAVTLNAPDDWRDHIQMFEWGFKNYSLRSLKDQGEVQFKIKETGEYLTGYVHESVQYPLTDKEYNQLNHYAMLNQAENVYQQVIGKMVFSLDAEPIVEASIYASPPRTAKNFSQEVIEILKKIIKVEPNG